LQSWANGFDFAVTVTNLDINYLTCLLPS